MNKRPNFCEKCQTFLGVRVISSEATERGRKRRYKCRCGARWNTVEKRGFKGDLSNFGLDLIAENIKKKIDSINSSMEGITKLINNLKHDQ